MYEDLTEEEAISLYMEFLCNELPVPDKLRAVISPDILELLEVHDVTRSSTDKPSE